MRHVQACDYTYDKGAWLILDSDGLSTHWKTQYPELAARSHEEDSMVRERALLEVGLNNLHQGGARQ
jgi:hypothetical protein